MRSTLTRFSLALGLAFAAACSKAPAAPSNFSPFTQTDLGIGSGATAALGNSVTVNYSGWLYDESKPDKKGPVFDSSYANSPFTFQLGSDQVIEGWDRGIVGMSVGGTRRLVIPPSLAYGATRQGVIPPYSTLVFDIQLVSVQ
jgi:FKBP-type peptidyl-prolyl cis-trans isomerase FkpA